MNDFSCEHRREQTQVDVCSLAEMLFSFILLLIIYKLGDGKYFVDPDHYFRAGLHRPLVCKATIHRSVNDCCSHDSP